jgi:hypothetical protein
VLVGDKFRSAQISPDFGGATSHWIAKFRGKLLSFFDGGPAMQDQLARAERYRQEAAKYHERAKFAEPAYLGDFFRQVAVRYMFMAQEAANGSTQRSEIASRRDVAEHTAPSSNGAA